MSAALATRLIDLLGALLLFTMLLILAAGQVYRAIYAVAAQAVFLGIAGAGTRGAPLANLMVDRLRDAGVLQRGAAYWLGRALRAAPGGGVVMGGTTLTASTTSGELSLTTEAFTDGFRTINGNESDAGVIFSAPNGTTIELTDGTTDQITTGFAALVRYEPLAP